MTGGSGSFRALEKDGDDVRESFAIILNDDTEEVAFMRFSEEILTQQRAVGMLNYHVVSAL